MRRVRDLMTPSPHTIGQEQSIAEAARRMRDEHIRHLPVLSGSSVVGMISVRDVQLAEATDPDGSPGMCVADVMAPEPYVVDGLCDVSTVARGMADRKIGSAIVTEHGRVAGIFTTTDALRALADQLEMHD